MKKPFNVDSTIENADWIKRGRLDLARVKSVKDILDFLNIEIPATKLGSETISSIMDYSWYESIPSVIKRDFSELLLSANRKEKKEKENEKL